MSGPIGDNTARASGVVAAAGGGGKVLQVVTNVSNTAVNSSASGWIVLTDIAVTITPSSSSSKIFVITDLPLYSYGGYDMWVTIMRDSTNIGQATTGFGNLAKRDGSSWNYDVIVSLNVLDAPATTSAITYSIQLDPRGQGGGGAGVIAANTPPCMITAWEIDGS
tara:strand:- start:1991 stop:2485 length:495 start_codon:yes stop_codon:yes gene_type:complete